MAHDPGEMRIVGLVVSIVISDCRTRTVQDFQAAQQLGVRATIPFGPHKTYVVLTAVNSSMGGFTVVRAELE